jgi:hypothetical protein
MKPSEEINQLKARQGDRYASVQGKNTLQLRHFQDVTPENTPKA